MNVDFDAAGSLINSSLIASEIEGASSTGKGHAHGANCANCAAPLAGEFCHQCGQRAHLHRSLLHLGEEFLHGMLHFDAKGWRTVPMLVGRPGQLTRRYIDGHRTRFVSPLALFLFMVFLMFFVVSSTSQGGKQGADGVRAALPAVARAKLEKSLAHDEARLDKAEKALAARLAKGGDTADAKDSVDEARTDLAESRRALELLPKLAGGDAAQAASAAAKAKDAGGADEEGDLGFKPENFNIGPGWPAADAALKHAFKNPELTLYKLKNAASTYSFLLVPISLPFLWLMFFWKRGVTMYDHAVFSLYSLSFMALLVVVMALLKYAGLRSGLVASLLFLPPVHMFIQLRGAYLLSRAEAFWRTLVLVCVAGTVFLLYLLLILMLSIR